MGFLPTVVDIMVIRVKPHQVDFIFFSVLMYALGIRFNVCTVGHFSAVRPPKISEVSNHALKSLAAHWSTWNGRGSPRSLGPPPVHSDSALHSPWNIWLQSFEPLIFFSYFDVVFIDNHPLSVLLECAYSPSWLPWPPGENKRGSTELHWFGEEGEDGWERQLQEKGCGQRRGMCQARIEEGVLLGGINGQEELGWV